jgi:hypothetical protein
MRGLRRLWFSLDNKINGFLETLCSSSARRKLGPMRFGQRRESRTCKGDL